MNKRLKSIKENLELHYILKSLFKGFIHAAHRYLEKRVRKDGDYYLPETRALYTALTRVNGNYSERDYVAEMRDLICVMAENQEFYEKMFVFAVKEFEKELPIERAKQEGR